MSRDIRSYFKTKPSTRDDDSDVIPQSPQMQITAKAKKTRRKRALSDDSDESPKKKISKKSPQKDVNKKGKSSGKALVEAKPSDLFGGSIKRTQPLKKQKNTETGIHSDSDFEMSLLELDETVEIEASSVKKEDSRTKSDYKEAESTSSHVERTKTESKGNSANKEDNKLNSKHKTNAITENKSKSKEHTDTKSDAKSHHKLKHSSSSEAESKLKISPRKDKKLAEKSSEKTTTENRSDSKESSVTKKKITPEVGKKPKRDDTDKAESSSRLDKLKINGIAKEAPRTLLDDSDEGKPKTPQGKKRKMDMSLNESVLTDEERHERRIHSAALYKSYLNRSGPKHLGAKKIPQGTPNCLKDCAFVLTGVLDSFEKDEIVKAIADYGGCVKSGVTKKVTHVLAGEDAGPAKLAKAQELNIKIIDEDEFLRMIVDQSETKAKNNSKSEQSVKKSRKRTNSPKDTKERTKQSSPPVTEVKSEFSIKREPDNLKSSSKKVEIVESSSVKRESDSVDVKPKLNNEVKSENTAVTKSDPASNTSMLWVDKHKPQKSKNIIGQHGPNSNVKKLTNWLTKWYANRKAKLPKPNPWAKNDDGGYYKAALLSGPPGVGKTATVTLVCQELGFDLVEFNASDTRNKALIKEQIGELLTTNSLSAYARGDTSKQAVTKKHVLVMDEVDGMAGNEDRGGLQELIGLIKSTSVPIICTCNDRNSPKMRSLVNYCFDLRFKRPTVDQIRSALSSVCFKEGIKAPPDVLAQLVVTAGQDVRHTLHLASLWAASLDTSTANPTMQRPEKTRPTKDVKLGPWDAVRKVFTASEHASMSISDKSDLFFYDYSLAPLFVQENYLSVVPQCPKDKVLSRVSMAADSISMGDLVEARIRRNQSWNLLPTQAMFSSVIPGHAMAGHMTGQIQFPGWLGKNSRKGKMRRLAQEIHAHTRLSTSGSKSSIFLDYCTYLRDAIINPMLKNKSEGVSESLKVLQSYHLLREDLDSLIELSLWPGQRNPMVLVESKVKAAMTRTYNKRATALPYAPPDAKRTTRNTANNSEESDPDEENYEDSPEAFQ